MKKIENSFLVKSTFIHYLIFGFSLISFGQNDNELIQKLERRLFPPNEGMQKILGVEGCEEQGLEEDYDIRKNQPDPEKVIEALEEIVFSKNVGLLPELIKLYERHINFYKKEWEPLYRENFYACAKANKQYQILEAFEETIHSLKFSEMELSPEDMYEYHRQYLESQYRYYYKTGEWFEALKKWEIHSSYYRMLREKRWEGAPGNHFCYIEPYLSEVQTFFVQELGKYLKKDESKEKLFLFEDYIYSHFCQLSGRGDFKQLSKELLMFSFTYTKADYRFAYKNLAYLFSGEQSKALAKPILMDRALSKKGEDRLFPLKGLGFFAEEDTLNLYKKILRDESASKEEKQVVLLNLTYFIKKNQVPESLKQEAKELLGSQNK